MTLEVARGLVGEVQQEVARLRKLEFTREVPVEVVGVTEMRKYMTERLTSFQSLEELQHGQRAYELLGLVPPGLSIVDSFMDALEEQAAGFYDPTGSAFYLMTTMPAGLAPVLIAHELTHALEDQHFDLDSRIRSVMHDDDRVFAVASVHEGSATLLMAQFVTRGLNNGTLSLEMLAAGNLDVTGTEAFERLPPAMQRQLIGPYVLGALFLARGNMLSVVTRGYPVDDVDRAYRQGPLSSEQILHPEKYWDPEQRDDPQELDLEGVGERLGPQWAPTASGVLGELMLAVLAGSTQRIDPALAILEGAASWTNPAASGWGGDVWEMWQRGDDALVLVLTAWDSPEDAAEFAAALVEGDGLRFKLAGDRVAILAGEAGAEVRFMLDEMLGGRSAPVVEGRQTE